MQQDVRQAVVRHDEAIALGDIEPLDDAGELDDLVAVIVGDVATCLRVQAPDPLEFRPTP